MEHSTFVRHPPPLGVKLSSPTFYFEKQRDLGFDKDLKKYFEQGPYSKSVELGSQTEMRCIPPDGVPVTVISWIRDGQQIDPKRDPNYIITADGHLLIAQTRLNDMGNYSLNGAWGTWSAWSECSGPCGKGVQKRSRVCNNPAPLNGGRPCSSSAVQKQDCLLPCPPVDGRWSGWSTWSSCGPECKHHKRRTCTNPSPSNGGKFCVGKDTMTTNCTGGLCKGKPNFAVKNAIKDSGSEFISIETTHSNSDQAARAVAETDIALYIGLGVAIVVFGIVAVVVIRLMRRKGRDHVMYDMAPSDYPPGYFPDHSKKLGMQPDLTANTSNGSTNSGVGLLFPEYTYPAGSTSNSHKETLPLTPADHHHYDVPHLHLQPNIHTASLSLNHYHPKSPLLINGLNMNNNCNNGIAVTALTTPSEENTVRMHQQNVDKNTYSDKNGGVPRCVSSDSVSSSFSSSSGPSRPNSLFYDESPENMGRGAGVNGSISGGGGGGSSGGGGANLFRDSITSTSLLLETCDPDCISWAHANSSGCRVTVKDTLVNLTIPEGSLAKTEEVFCAILTDEKDRPHLADGQTLLSPVISCGPRNVQLKKPAILSFQHCAALKMSNQGWIISLYHYEHETLTSSSTSSSDNNYGNWKKLATVGEETMDTPVFLQMDSNQVYLVTDHLSKFALIGESTLGRKAVKTLRLVAFSQAQVNNPTTTNEYTIRVYVLDDTTAALERVMSREKGLGGKVLDKPRSLLFQDGGENLCISLEDIGTGWKCKGSYQELEFCRVWGNRQSDLHCSFTLEKTERRVNAICFRLVAYQHVHNYLRNGHVQKLTSQKITFRIRTELSGNKSRTNQFSGVATSSPEVTMAPRSSTVTSSGCSSMVTLEPNSPLSRLPQTLKKKLCHCLDQNHPNGKDWRLLAKKLGVDERYTKYLTMKTSSPTEHILDLWDVKNRKPEAITDLLNALRLMERHDAVGLLEKEMGPWI
ncbi:Netrin receptor UNC5C [Folsomia candida]|uniref:Netrin receptor UNC5 n=1 Tax=Folsomia candida TaxID=158441 RepID=A0A226DE75_FOLCA|nr:Netrin receptor UNC5C [Folsomia candida]